MLMGSVNTKAMAQVKRSPHQGSCTFFLRTVKIEDKRDADRQHKQRVEPPSGHVLVLVHHSRVDVELVLLRRVEAAVDLLPVEQRNVGDGGRYRREAKTIRECEEGTHVDPPILLVHVHVDLEAVVQDRRMMS